MHEVSVARSLIREVEAIAARAGAERVTSIRVRVGEFSGVDPDLLQSAVALVTTHGIARNLDVIVERIALTARCSACDSEFAVQRFKFICPKCCSTETRIVAGEELVLDTVTLEGPGERDAVDAGAFDEWNGPPQPVSAATRRTSDSDE